MTTTALSPTPTHHLSEAECRARASRELIAPVAGAALAELVDRLLEAQELAARRQGGSATNR